MNFKLPLGDVSSSAFLTYESVQVIVETLSGHSLVLVSGAGGSEDLVTLWARKLLDPIDIHQSFTPIKMLFNTVKIRLSPLGLYKNYLSGYT